MPVIKSEDNTTTSATKTRSSNMNRNTINAIAIRSHQVEDWGAVGVIGDSFEGWVLKNKFRIYNAFATATPTFGGS